MELEVGMSDNIHTDSLTITPKILRLIAEIDEFKGAWAAIGRISPERLAALRRVATIESIGSSTRIEGANRNTIKDHIKALKRAGHLVQHGAGRGTWYGLT